MYAKSFSCPLAWFFLVSMSIVPILTYADPEPMARPTRPKVFTNAEELRRYLDLVRDYYSLNGKARYGKRAPPTSAPSSGSDFPGEKIRGFLGALRRVEGCPEGQRLRGDLSQEEDPPKQFRQEPRGPSRSSNLLYEEMDKFYDEAQ
ncbi:uncharacterized protein LOC105702531 [Orussus abietinus]|uniref:uncharacterized protein LOC105702531 n=1 Tax=Orussus abietinus TaxID=222816 RepID=UPI0006251C5A|nr:uncharacterized protein LOC105702531 [Orussus abietinus]